jgi:hypothetical protein
MIQRSIVLTADYVVLILSVALSRQRRSNFTYNVTRGVPRLYLHSTNIINWHTFGIADAKTPVYGMELLKLLVLIKAGVFLDSRHQAYELSEAIYDSTGQFISATKLLHLYGLSPAKLPPSTYIKDALAKFCDYESYDAYMKDMGIDDDST